MTTRIFQQSGYGSWIVAITAALGLLVCLIAYFTPHGTIAYSYGALIVVISTALMMGASLAMALRPLPRWLFVLFEILIILDVLATAVCAYFLESYVLLALMAAALAGWIICLSRDSSRVVAIG